MFSFLQNQRRGEGKDLTSQNLTFPTISSSFFSFFFCPNAKHILSPLAYWLSAFNPTPLSALKNGRGSEKRKRRKTEKGKEGQISELNNFLWVTSCLSGSCSSTQKSKKEKNKGAGKKVSPGRVTDTHKNERKRKKSTETE